MTNFVRSRYHQNSLNTKKKTVYVTNSSNNINQKKRKISILVIALTFILMFYCLCNYLNGVIPNKEPKMHMTDMEKIKVDDDEENKNDGIGVKMKLDEKELETSMPQTVQNEMTNGIENEKAATEDTASDDTRDKNAKLMLKKKIKGMEKKKLDDFASNVVDNVRLHESGWKVSSMFLSVDRLVGSSFF